MLDDRPGSRPPPGARGPAPGHGAPPSSVRLRLGCPDQPAYRARYGARHRDRGVFVPADRIRARPVGTRLHLTIELGDGSLAYSGGAVVAAHVAGGPRPGYLLELEPLELELEIAEPPPASPAPPVGAGHGTPVAGGGRPAPVNISRGQWPGALAPSPGGRENVRHR